VSVLLNSNRGCMRLEHIERRGDVGVFRGVRLEPLEAAAVGTSTYVTPPLSDRCVHDVLCWEVPTRGFQLQSMRQSPCRVCAERGGDE